MFVYVSCEIKLWTVTRDLLRTYKRICYGRNSCGARWENDQYNQSNLKENAKMGIQEIKITINKVKNIEECKPGND